MESTTHQPDDERRPDAAPSAVSGVPPEVPDEGKSAPVASVRGHLRGSSLLLAGRLLALLLNFAAQVLTVRYLSKSDYGAFAYALAIVSVGTNINLLGLQRAVARFVPLHHERRDLGAMLGTIVLAASTVIGVGAALVLLTFGFSSSITQSPLAAGLLLVMIVLCPLEAFDNLCQGIVASLASPRAIFLRRHVLGPGLKLAAVLLVYAVEGSVVLLAWCWVIAGLIGLSVYVLVILRVLRERGLLQGFDRRRVFAQAREVFRYSLPLLTADVAVVLKPAMAVLVLEWLGGAGDVAEFRAVLPVAGLNLVALQTLKLLFTPTASRLFARGDREGLNDLYWQSGSWIALVTFPVFATCWLLAEPLSVTLFGSRYATAAAVLAVLAAGDYFNAAMGLNTYTLQVWARVRWVLSTSIASALTALLLNLWLVPSHGALGAAIATSGAVVLQNVLNHEGLRRRTEIEILEWRRWKVHATVLATALAFLIVELVFEPPTAVWLVSIAAASLGLLRANRRSLKLAATFPELARAPLIGPLLAVKEAR